MLSERVLKGNNVYVLKKKKPHTQKVHESA